MKTGGLLSRYLDPANPDSKQAPQNTHSASSSITSSESTKRSAQVQERFAAQGRSAKALFSRMVSSSNSVNKSTPRETGASQDVGDAKRNSTREGLKNLGFKTASTVMRPFSGDSGLKNKDNEEKKTNENKSSLIREFAENPLHTAFGLGLDKLGFRDSWMTKGESDATLVPYGWNNQPAPVLNDKKPVNPVSPPSFSDSVTAIGNALLDFLEIPVQPVQEKPEDDEKNLTPGIDPYKVDVPGAFPDEPQQPVKERYSKAYAAMAPDLKKLEEEFAKQMRNKNRMPLSQKPVSDIKKSSPVPLMVQTKFVPDSPPPLLSDIPLSSGASAMSSLSVDSSVHSDPWDGENSTSSSFTLPSPSSEVDASSPHSEK